MCVWAYGAIYSWRPEMDLYQSSLPAVFAAILLQYTIAESPLQRLLESLLETLLESLLESVFESLIENLLVRDSHREE